MSQELQTINSDQYGNLFSAVEKKERELEQQRKKEEFDKKLVTLAETAIRYENTNPEMYELLENFLQVAIQLKGVMETVSAINVAMETLSDAVEFIDAALDYDSSLMDLANSKKYGFWQRLKMQWQMNKTINNNRGRVKAIAKSLEMKYKMATDMQKMLTGVSKKLTKSITKNNKKKSKNNETANTSNEAKLFIQNLKNSSDGGASTSTSSTKTDSVGGADSDISDIL